MEVQENRVTSYRIGRFGAVRRTIAALALVMATITVGAASVSADSGSSRSAQTHQAASLGAGTATVASPQLAPIDACPFEWICAYPGTNFSGTPIKMFTCGVDTFIPFVGNGSWINNQTSGTRAKFKDDNHHVIFTTPGAFSANTSYNWTTVFYVQAC